MIEDFDRNNITGTREEAWLLIVVSWWHLLATCAPRLFTKGYIARTQRLKMLRLLS